MKPEKGTSDIILQSGKGKDRRFIQDQIKCAMVERDFDRANMWLKLLRIYDEFQED